MHRARRSECAWLRRDLCLQGKDHHGDRAVERRQDKVTPNLPNLAVNDLAITGLRRDLADAFF